MTLSRCYVVSQNTNDVKYYDFQAIKLFMSFRYDYVEVEDPDGGMVLGRWCGSQSAPGPQTSKGNQIRVRFVSDEYFPSEPGFSFHYSVLQQVSRLQLLLSL